MKRALLWFVTAGVVLLAVGAGVYAVRTRAAKTSATSGHPAGQRPMTDTPAADRGQADARRGSSPAATPRAEVTIDPRRQQLIGVQTVAVKRSPLGRILRTVGVVRYDETRLADVNVKVEGWIRDLYVDYTGQPIRQGQALFTLYSPELLTTENEYLLALKTRDQMQQSAIPDARERAEQLVASARQRLALWDLPPEEIRALEETTRAPDVVTFRSPVAGFVIDKQALKGLHVMPGQSLYKVADLSVVWVEADVYENEVSSIRAGARATVTVEAYPGDRFSSRVIYVYPYLDEQTRTNKVRFEFANRSGRFKPGMYANVELPVGGGTGLTVPTNAVLESGTDQVVFVAQGDGLFEPRRVKVGRRLGEAVQILEGLKEGEDVATGAAFFLDSESQLHASLQAYQAPPAPAGAAATAVSISFRTVPDPAQTGDNQLEATIKDGAGKPIDDAEVTVQFFMPAMPTMNMPAMRSEAKLSPAGNGLYRGRGQVMMAGRWDATVSVTRGGRRLGGKQFSVVAK